jgi:Protein of unknown function (DUF1026).
MIIGDLDRRIEIERETKVQNTYGELISTWSNILEFGQRLRLIKIRK